MIFLKEPISKLSVAAPALPTRFTRSFETGSKVFNAPLYAGRKNFSAWSPGGMRVIFTMFLFALAAVHGARAQSIFAWDEPVSPEVEIIYGKGLAFLQKMQNENGSWPGRYGDNPGVVGLCLVSMLAHGEDPNYGPYSGNIKRGLDFIINSSNKSNGYIGHSMYNHGFATLALAEAYGQVHDERLGPALKKAVELLLSSQKRNPFGAWRYSPESSDADTTVSGACAVALFAAANAGVEVPENAIKQILKYYVGCQNSDGGFSYTGGGSGSNAPRTAIGNLVFALAKKKDSRPYKKSIRYLLGTGAAQDNYYYYYLYYAAQAFFHSENRHWSKWNKVNIKTLKAMQREDGSWEGSHGESFSTASALLSLALNYRFLPIYER